MSFAKKLDEFLSEAKTQGVIDAKTQNKLQKFAQDNDKKSGIATFLNIIGFFGGLAIILGLILVISHNWSEISNFTKISIYLITLLGLYFSAYRLADNHQPISEVIYFIAAGYVLAGIGLIAQIFHLTSNNGTAFLAWFMLILPLALILKNKWIGVMAAFAFYLWLNIQVSQGYYFSGSSKAFIIYFITMATSMILLPRAMKQINNCFDHVRIIGIILLSFAILGMGFLHEITNYYANDALNIHPITQAILAFNIVLLTLVALQKGIYNKIVVLLLFLVNLLPFLISAQSATFIAVLYWAIWFAFGALLIYQGTQEEDKSMINYGTWCVMLGIIIRFIDLVGTMLFTGAMFILFGAILIGIAYAGEKYRKNLINKFTANHAKQKK